MSAVFGHEVTVGILCFAADVAILILGEEVDNFAATIAIAVDGTLTVDEDAIVGN